MGEESSQPIRRGILVLLLALATWAPPALADPPTLSSVPAMIVEATSASGASVSYTVPSTTDDNLLDPNPAASCDPAPGSTFPLGPTVVTCSATDSATSEASSESFTVTVQDTTAPAITVPGSPVTASTTDPAGTAVTFSASATDIVDGAVSPSCMPASGSTFPIGSTTVTCWATDVQRNTSSAAFTVSVTLIDTTPPTVSVPPDMTVEATGPGGAQVPYTATAADNVDGSLAPTCDHPSGSPFPLGSTTVTCWATDAQGNRSSDAMFTVTVQDTTAPVLTLPGNLQVEATGPSGAAVTFAASAADVVDGPVTPACTASSGSTLPLGPTVVTCTAIDAHMNPASGSFTVTVVDTTAPTFGNLPGNQTAEADGPGGSHVSYGQRTAVDAVDGPVLVSCSPSSGSLFALGATAVGCTAADTRGNVASITFTVNVVDTTAPVLTVAGDIVVSSGGAASVPASDPVIAKFLDGSTAVDLVDGSPRISSNAPPDFSLGTTVVLFTATDHSGNSTTGRATVTVVEQPVRAQPPVDRTPPGNPDMVSVKVASNSVIIDWRGPHDSDFDHVTIFRWVSGSSTDPIVVYQGTGRSFTDHAVRNGRVYRYVLVSYDHAGNRSVGVAAVAAPVAPQLVRPPNGAHVALPITLAWVPAAGVSYYNLQVLHAGHKILSVWPGTNHFVVTRTVVFAGHRYTFTAGVYLWVVFPGYGAHAANKYGPPLGESTFVV